MPIFRIARRCVWLAMATLLGLAAPEAARAATNLVADSTVQFNATLGSFNVELFNADAPLTVQSFLTYVSKGNASAGGYNNSFFHRLVQGFVLQGGGYYANAAGGASAITSSYSAPSEYSAAHPNVAGTIAMALSGSSLTSTNQFFINLVNNPSLNSNVTGGGPYTVFGQITGAGMTAVNQLAGVAPNTANIGIWNFGGSLNTLPLVNYINDGRSPVPYLEAITSIVVLPSGPHEWGLSAGGVWSSTANWTDGISPNSNATGGTVPNGTDSKALFGNNLVGAGSVSLGSTPQTMNTLEFASGGNHGAYTITGSSAGILILNGGSGSATIQLDSTNRVTQTISAPISFATNTTINNQSTGGALLVLSGSQNWNGSTLSVASGGVKFNNATTGTVNSGAGLSIGSGAAVELAGTTSGTTGVAVTNSGSLNVTGANQRVGTISGTGITTISATGNLTVAAVNQGLTNAGTLTLTAGASVATSLTDGSSSPAAGSTSYSGNTTVGSSSQAASLTTNVVRQSSLTVGVVNGAAATVTINASNPSTYVLPGDTTVPKGSNSGTSILASLSIANNGAGTYYGTLDLKNNNLLIDYTTTVSPIDGIRQAILSAYNNGNWNGAGLTSSTILQDTSNFALGFGENNDPSNALRFDNTGNLFEGTPVATHAIAVKFTWKDDLTLDGVVDSSDAIVFGTNYDNGATTGHSFAQGDLNYDGVIDSSDAIIFGTAYNTSLAQLPEPSSFVLAGLGLIGLLGLLVARRRGFQPSRSITLQ